MRYELDRESRFVCDLLCGSAAEYWTADAIPQPIGNPRYIGASYNPPSGECFGGVWVDEASPVVALAPIEVTMRQARLALLHSGLLEEVELALSNLSGEEGHAARIEWEYSQVVRRNKPFVLAVGQALRLSSVQLDDLFRFAASIE